MGHKRRIWQVTRLTTLPATRSILFRHTLRALRCGDDVVLSGRNKYCGIIFGHRYDRISVPEICAYDVTDIMNTDSDR